MTISPYIFDLKDAEFDELVMANSSKEPVLVNFWSAKARALHDADATPG